MRMFLPTDSAEGHRKKTLLCANQCNLWAKLFPKFVPISGPKSVISYP